MFADLSFNLEKTWGRISTLHSAEHLMLAAGGILGENDAQMNTSVAEDHSFPILDVREIDGQRVLKIRNLWGRKHEALCRWGQDSIEWTPRYKKLLDYSEQYDGTLITIWIYAFPFYGLTEFSLHTYAIYRDILDPFQ